MPRTVTLVLVDACGDVLGALPPFEVATPWWQDVADVVRAARFAHGIDVTILRLLRTELPRPHGGGVTYLAEVAAPRPAGVMPTDEVLDDHPLRQSWARPGGTRTDIAWADEQLRRLGAVRVGRPEQIRAWNLSSLWRLTTSSGLAWLKVVPSFFAHEGDVIARITIGPPLIAHHRPRSLLRHVAGRDLYDATPGEIRTTIGLLVGEQIRWIGRTADLLALGVPDWRAAALTDAAAEVVERTAPELESAVLDRARRLVAGLEVRFAAIGACGIPDSLVHGDFHQGNVRADGSATVVLDWGDSGVGHPLLDQAALLERLAPAAARAAREAFTAAWRHAIPGSDPATAGRLLGPIAALRHAIIYRRFLDHIEPSERAFHRDDPANWITRATH